MRREEALRLLAEHTEELRGLGVTSLLIFGSVARDEARPDSDVDILVEFRDPVGYLHLAKVQHRLESFLGAPVDITTPSGIRESMRARIMREAIRAA